MKKMTLMQHFSELRRRILWVALIFVICFIVGWYVAPMMQSFLTGPLLSVWPDGELLYTGLSDGVMIHLSLAGLFALIMILPVVLWHVWAFVAPGLKKQERKIIWPLLLSCPLLFVLGAWFAFCFLFPVVFKFFIQLNQSAPVPAMLMPVARDYLNMAIGLMKIFGVAFQLPLILILLNRIGVFPRMRAVQMRRYVIVFIIIVAAILTPPDVVSQIMLAIPMWLLFEISILFMRRD